MKRGNSDVFDLFRDDARILLGQKLLPLLFEIVGASVCFGNTVGRTVADLTFRTGKVAEYQFLLTVGLITSFCHLTRLGVCRGHGASLFWRRGTRNDLG